MHIVLRTKNNVSFEGSIVIYIVFKKKKYSYIYIDVWHIVLVSRQSFCIATEARKLMNHE